MLSARISRTWLYKDLKVWDFQQIDNYVAYIVACRAWKSGALGSTPTRGNILLMDFFFLFSRNSAEFYRMHLHLEKTRMCHYVLWSSRYSLFAQTLGSPRACVRMQIQHPSFLWVNLKRETELSSCSWLMFPPKIWIDFIFLSFKEFDVAEWSFFRQQVAFYCLQNC